MGYTKERLRHAVRFRHKRGYGVHSPFMFYLMTNVICDQRNRYTYPPQAEQMPGMRRRERKLYRLLSRLCLYLSAHWREGAGVCSVFYSVCCTEDETGRATCYLAGQPEIRQVATENPGVEGAAFIFVGTEASRSSGQPDIPGLIAPDGQKCILVKEIHRNGANNRLWRRLKEQATVSVDMLWYGILLFDEKVQKGTYYLTI